MGNVKKEPDWLGKFVKRIDALSYDDWAERVDDMPVDVLDAYNARKSDESYKPSNEVRRYLVELNRPSNRQGGQSNAAFFELMRRAELTMERAYAERKAGYDVDVRRDEFTNVKTGEVITGAELKLRG